MKTKFLWFGLAALAALGTAFAQGQHKDASKDPNSPKRADKVRLTDAEWKKRLTPEQYRILRRGATEQPYCSVLNDQKEAGTFFCAGCKLALFKSDSKFDSKTGWPSFFQPVAKDSVWLRVDRGFGMVREEVLCSRCDGHLGHRFQDGPKPTGLRYCINGECLKFVADKKKK